MISLFVVRRIIRSCGLAGFSLQNLMANIPLFRDFGKSLMCSYVSDTIWDLFPFIYSSFSFMQYIHPDQFPLSSPTPIQCSSISLQERARFPGIATEHGITRCSKTMHHCCWTIIKDTMSQKSASPLIKVRIDTTIYAYWLSPAEKWCCLCRMRAAQEPVPTRHKATVSSILLSARHGCSVLY